jgi:GT2 family glycosyltransferase
MHNKPLATIAFVFRERLSSTVSCLEHLLATTAGPYELICVDAGSPEKIASRLRELASQHGFTLIRSEVHLTPNESRNLALEQVRTPYIVFVDNDVKVGENWLEPLVRCAEETGAWLVAPLYMQSLRGELKIHMFGGEIRVNDEQGRPAYFEKHQLQHRSPGGEHRLERRSTDLVEFHTVLMNMQAYRQLGPLDEKLYNCSEHADLSLAVKKAGKEIYLEPASVITYQIPDRLEAMDRDYFALRWSEAWTQASLDRLAEKYVIPRDEIGLRQIGIWVTLHRQRVLAGYPRLGSLVGRKLQQAFRRRIAKPLEKRQNLRRYPAPEYVANRNIAARVVSV